MKRKESKPSVFKQGVVIDFETNGNGVDKNKSYRPYAEELMPLPRPNYPIELTALIFTEDGVIDRKTWLIRGATRLDPWVIQNVPGANIQKYDKGQTFVQVASELKKMMKEPLCIIGHNVDYDYKDVLLTVELEEDGAELAKFFKACPTFCTMVNEYTKKMKNPRPLAYYYSKLNKWMGPSLKNLAVFLQVDYDDASAHSSEYDVDVTYNCYIKMIGS
jgi:DNA polymerase III epsilon subunit-like protein